jgi:hypothetical protein
VSNRLGLSPDKITELRGAPPGTVSAATESKVATSEGLLSAESDAAVVEGAESGEMIGAAVPGLDLAIGLHVASDYGAEKLKEHNDYVEAHKTDLPSGSGLSDKVGAAPQKQDPNPPAAENYNATQSAYPSATQ